MQKNQKSQIKVVEKICVFLSLFFLVDFYVFQQVIEIIRFLFFLYTQHFMKVKLVSLRQVNVIDRFLVDRFVCGDVERLNRGFSYIFSLLIYVKFLFWNFVLNLYLFYWTLTFFFQGFIPLGVWVIDYNFFLLNRMSVGVGNWRFWCVGIVDWVFGKNV